MRRKGATQGVAKDLLGTACIMRAKGMEEERAQVRIFPCMSAHLHALCSLLRTASLTLPSLHGHLPLDLSQSAPGLSIQAELGKGPGWC